MNKNYKAIIAGSGFAGAVCARKLAENGFKVLVLEKREHIGGNAFDCFDDSGVLIHKYGPHIFHTNHKHVFDFLSRFTEWNNYEHCVKANIYGNLISVPFNLESVYACFPHDKADKIEQRLTEHYGKHNNVSILDLLKANDNYLKALGQYVYENIFLHYTVKQWGTKPEQINSSTTARVPVRISSDGRYFTDTYQGLPKNGYTKMFENILFHPNIEFKTNADCFDFIEFYEKDGILFNKGNFDGAFIYTGEIEHLLKNRFGNLPYRTLQFEFETLNKEYFQPCGTVNYTVNMPFTRITEFKHMTGQKLACTTILREYSKQYTGSIGEIPYYPVINPESESLYQKYRDNLSDIKNMFLIGRLAEYKYYNMDMVVVKALEVADEIIEQFS